VTRLAERVPPLGQAWTPGIDNHERVGLPCSEHLQNLGEREQLVSNLLRTIVAPGDADLMGLHWNAPQPWDIYYNA
jgi:hypothetical protein